MQDLHIDLLGLAASLSHLPVWEVLDTDVALCKSFLSNTAKLVETPKTFSRSETSRQTSQPPEIDAAQPNAPALLMPASPASRESNDKSNATPPGSKVQSVLSTKADAETSHPKPAKASAGMTQSQAEMPQTPTAHVAVSRQTGQHASAAEPDLDDLDALLNAPHLSDKSTKESTKVSKPPHQEQDLEDWLNSL